MRLTDWVVVVMMTGIVMTSRGPGKFAAVLFLMIFLIIGVGSGLLKN